MTFRILLPAEFQDIHRQVVLAWVHRGHEFTSDEWRIAFRAFDLLKEATVVTKQGLLPFPLIYYRQVEELQAETFIRTLLNSDEVEKVGIRLWAETAASIPKQLHQAGLTPTNQPAARLLVAYCLYWWYAFAHGYIFEVEILGDLAQSGVQFTAHDLTQRHERLSAWDLEVLGFHGDIKRSLFFLQTVRGQRLPHTFYIVRLTQAGRSRTLIVMMRQAMWNMIDGETILTTLGHLADVLPDTARVQLAGVEIIIADYTLWKRLVRQRQSTQVEDNDG